MRQIIRFLLDNPLVLVILVAWIAGALANVGKAMKKARDRAAAQQRPTPMEPKEARRDVRSGGQVREPAPAPHPIRSDEIAAEMQRILRGRHEPSAGDVMRQQEHVPKPPPLPRPPTRARNVSLPERPPTPVLPSASRRLPIHVDPHVGEGIARRSSVRSGHVGEHARGQELGQLGGRVHVTAHGRTATSRYSLTDLKRLIVMNEILGPPLALRGSGGREL